MIGYIKGEVLSQNNGSVLIVNNGIGYEVACSSACFKNLSVGKVGEIYTYMAVRDDGVYLYGFISPEEKNMFLKLITVSGVGPKMGITVLSGMSLSDIALKIATSDAKGLATVKGLGKKTAERIILELREKIAQVDTETGEITVNLNEEAEDESDKDAVIALMSLGLTKSECVKGIKSAKASGAKTIEQIISYTLRNIK